MPGSELGIRLQAVKVVIVELNFHATSLKEGTKSVKSYITHSVKMYFVIFA
jgi:hypothetical protein